MFELFKAVIFGIVQGLSLIHIYGRREVSVIGVSLAGAAAHNLGQLLAVAALLASSSVFYYLPWLLLWSVPMGFLTGFSAKAAIKALRNIGFDGTM